MQAQSLLGQLRLSSRLRNKIVFPYIFLTLLLAFAGTYVVTQLVTGSLEDRLTTFLLEGGRATNEGLAKAESDQLEALRGIVFTVGMPEAVAARDLTPVLVENLLAYKINQRLDGVEVVDSSGRELYGILHGPDPSRVEDYTISRSRDLSSWHLVSRVLAGETDEFGDKFSELIPTEGGYILFTGGPFKIGNEVVGAVLVGRYLDNVLQSISREALAQVAIYDSNGQLLSTTVSGARDEDSPFSSLRPQIISQIDPAGGSLVSESLTWRGTQYRVIYAPLSIRQEPLGILAVALPTDFIPETTALGRNLMIILFTAASFAVLVIGYFLSERITQPIMNLARAALRVASGDFSQQVVPQSKDEIGVLAAAFNSMTRDLKAYTDQLRDRVTELSLLFETSRELGRSLELKEVMEIAIEAIYRTGDLRFAFLLLRDPDSGEYAYQAVRGQNPIMTRRLESQRVSIKDPMLSQSIHQGRPLTLDAAYVGRKLREELGLGTYSGSLLAIPLLAKAEPIGLILAGKGEGSSFTNEEQVHLISTIAGEAARAIQNARLYREITQRLEQLLALQQLSQVIVSKLSLDEVLSQAMGELVRMMQGGSAVLALTDAASGRLEVVATRGLPQAAKKILEESGMEVTRWVTANGQAVIYDREAAFVPEEAVNNQRGTAICVPLQVEGEIIGAIDVWSPSLEEEFHKQDLVLLSTVANQSAVAIKNARLYENIRKLNLSIVQSLAAAIDARDPYTHGHSNRVTQNTMTLGRRIGFNDAQLQSLEIASYLHDLGKIGVRDSILLKPGNLTPEERKHIDDHPRIGARILAPVGFDEIVVGGVLHHHERFDGTGYPDGLRGEDIPLSARILSVSDAFDAMVSDRPYRKAMSVKHALNALRDNAGRQFDPGVVGQFLEAYKADELIMPEEAELDGHEATEAKDESVVEAESQN